MAKIFIASYGNDSTGVRGDINHPFLTFLGVFGVHQQGDHIVMLTDITMNTEQTMPSYSTYVMNWVYGSSSPDGSMDGTLRKIYTTTSAANAFAQNTWPWIFVRIEFANYSNVFRATSTYGLPDWSFYSCKFTNISSLNTGASLRPQLHKCVFSNCATTGALATGVDFYDCNFIGCATTSTSTSLLLSCNTIRSLFVSCSAARYLVYLSIAGKALENCVFDRCVITSTLTIDNLLVGTSTQQTRICNNLFTNCYGYGSGGTRQALIEERMVTSLNVINNNAVWNCTGSMTTRIIKTGTNSLYYGQNPVTELTETPWKNDDGIIANAMTSYEYKPSYLLRNKNVLLSDISGLVAV